MRADSDNAHAASAAAASAAAGIDGGEAAQLQDAASTWAMSPRRHLRRSDSTILRQTRLDFAAAWQEFAQAEAATTQDGAAAPAAPAAPAMLPDQVVKRAAGSHDGRPQLAAAAAVGAGSVTGSSSASSLATSAADPPPPTAEAPTEPPSCFQPASGSQQPVPLLIQPDADPLHPRHVHSAELPPPPYRRQSADQVAHQHPDESARAPGAPTARISPRILAAAALSSPEDCRTAAPSVQIAAKPCHPQVCDAHRHPQMFLSLST